jgi:DNA-binding response OmpR family regulator
MSPSGASNILIVEEDPIQAAALQGYLRERGYSCDLAATPRHALDLCEHELYDLALVNAIYRGVHGSGSHLIDRLQHVHFLPSLLVTGVRDPPTGSGAVLRKPYTGRQCLRMIAAQLRLTSPL